MRRVLKEFAFIIKDTFASRGDRVKLPLERFYRDMNGIAGGRSAGMSSQTIKKLNDSGVNPHGKPKIG